MMCYVLSSVQRNGRRKVKVPYFFKTYMRLHVFWKTGRQEVYIRGLRTYNLAYYFDAWISITVDYLMSFDLPWIPWQAVRLLRIPLFLKSLASSINHILFYFTIITLMMENDGYTIWSLTSLASYLEQAVIHNDKQNQNWANMPSQVDTRPDLSQY